MYTRYPGRGASERSFCSPLPLASGSTTAGIYGLNLHASLRTSGVNSGHHNHHTEARIQNPRCKSRLKSKGNPQSSLCICDLPGLNLHLLGQVQELPQKSPRGKVKERKMGSYRKGEVQDLKPGRPSRRLLTYLSPRLPSCAPSHHSHSPSRQG